jgi:hypothetical protein
MPKLLYWLDCKGTGMKMEKLDAILSVLRCPRTGLKLQRVGGELITDTGEHYPIVNGKPILVRQIQSFHVTPPKSNIISQNIDEYRLGADTKCLPGYKIHIGSGNVPCYDPNVISVDILPTANVDIVAEAECLPFCDNSIAFAESGAVFEHLYDPISAISEVKRILRPGGRFFIDTAFMQGYHGFPCHYYNMTSQAVETFIVDDFELITSSIPRSGSPAMALDNFLRRFIAALPYDDRVRFSSMTVAAFLSELSDSSIHLYDCMSEHVKRSLAATTCVTAQKPYNYKLDNSEQMVSIRRNYYSQRVGVIERYYECEHYRGRAIEGGVSPNLSNAIQPLNDLLESYLIKDTNDFEMWRSSTESLHKIDIELTGLRDIWNRHYLTIADSLNNKEQLLLEETARLNAELIQIRNSTFWKLRSGFRKIKKAILLS